MIFAFWFGKSNPQRTGSVSFGSNGHVRFCSLCFLNEMEEKREYAGMDYVYAVLFSMVFMAYPIRALGSSGMLYIALYLLLATVLADEFVHLVKARYRR